MTLDMYMFDNDLPATTTPSFLIPAASLTALTNELWMPKLYIWTIQAALSISLSPKPQEGYTSEQFEHALLDPLVAGPLAPSFVGVSTACTISEARGMRFQQRYVGKYAAGDHLNKLQSLQFGATEKVQAGLFGAAAERYQMALRYTHVLWECHLPALKEEDGELVTVLWILTAGVYAERTQVLIQAAGGAEDAAKRGVYEEARRNGEVGIEYLSVRWPFTEHDMVEEKVRSKVRKMKAKLSFRVSMACQGMKDGAAAVEYSRQAIQYDPETKGPLQKHIDELSKESGDVGDGASDVVVWCE
jgi:hypothetical protein